MGDDGSTMTDLLSSRAEPVTQPAPAASPPPAWLPGAAAGVAIAGAGLLSCLGLAVLTWLSGDGGSVTGALRAGATGWLLGHGSGITTPRASITVVPLGLTLVVVALSWYAGRWAARVSGAGDSVRGAASIAAAVGLGYAVTVLVVAVVSTAPAVSVSWYKAVPIALLLTGGFAGLGAAAVGGTARAWLDHLPEDVQIALRGAVAGVTTLLCAAALILVASVMLHLSALQRMLSSLDLGLVAGLVLLVACVLVLPNAALFTVSVLLGPGFALGTGTSVNVIAVHLGAVPAVPWFAAVPSPGSPPLWVAGLTALPIACGVAAGVVAVRRAPVAGYRQAAWRGVLAGGLAGAGVAALVAASGGSIGPGRMSDVGPAVLACVAVAVPAMAAGGLLGGTGARLVRRSSPAGWTSRFTGSRPPDPEASDPPPIEQ